MQEEDDKEEVTEPWRWASHRPVSFPGPYHDPLSKVEVRRCAQDHSARKGWPELVSYLALPPLWS